MALETIMLVVGWAMFATPIVVFLSITTRLVIGAAKDDDVIMATLGLGVTICVIGGGILLAVYLTDLLV